MNKKFDLDSEYEKDIVLGSAEGRFEVGVMACRKVEVELEIEIYVS